MKKLCTNGISDSSRSLRGLPRATIPFAALSSTMQWSATRKMLGSSCVTMTTVMPRSRLSVRMSSVELDRRDRVETGGRLVEEQEIGLEHQGAGDAGALFHAARDFAWQMLGERSQARRGRAWPGRAPAPSHRVSGSTVVNGSARFSASVIELKSAPD